MRAYIVRACVVCMCVCARARVCVFIYFLKFWCFFAPLEGFDDCTYIHVIIVVRVACPLKYIYIYIYI